MPKAVKLSSILLINLLKKLISMHTKSSTTENVYSFLIADDHDNKDDSP